jgi:hypothetical protein
MLHTTKAYVKQSLSSLSAGVTNMARQVAINEFSMQWLEFTSLEAMNSGTIEVLQYRDRITGENIQIMCLDMIMFLMMGGAITGDHERE